jgi:hypothetical protein
MNTENDSTHSFTQTYPLMIALLRESKEKEMEKKNGEFEFVSKGSIPQSLAHHTKLCHSTT